MFNGVFFTLKIVTYPQIASYIFASHSWQLLRAHTRFVVRQKEKIVVRQKKNPPANFRLAIFTPTKRTIHAAELCVRTQNKLCNFSSFFFWWSSSPCRCRRLCFVCCCFCFLLCFSFRWIIKCSSHKGFFPIHSVWRCPALMARRFLSFSRFVRVIRFGRYHRWNSIGKLRKESCLSVIHMCCAVTSYDILLLLLLYIFLLCHFFLLSALW